jgi:hypothetical protein
MAHLSVQDILTSHGTRRSTIFFSVCLVCFRQACVTSHFVSITAATSFQPMYSLWTAVATTMFQQLKAFKNLLGLYLHRRQAQAWLAHVHASD